MVGLLTGFVLTFALGVFILFKCLQEFKIVKNYIRNGILVDAVVISVEVKIEKDSEGYRYEKYYVIAAYTASDIRYEQRVLSTFSLKKVKIGDILSVRYLPDSPKTIRLARKEYLAFGALCFVALITIIGSFVMLYFSLLGNI